VNSIIEALHQEASKLESRLSAVRTAITALNGNGQTRPCVPSEQQHGGTRIAHQHVAVSVWRSSVAGWKRTAMALAGARP
jgi:hypothetical protein